MGDCRDNKKKEEKAPLKRSEYQQEALTLLCLMAGRVFGTVHPDPY